MKARYIPNLLSCLRILMIPLFIRMFFGCATIYPALLVFLTAGLTDVIDGYLARRNNWITNVGKLLDPLADKAMQCAVLLCFTAKGLVPELLVSLFILKEIFMIAGAVLVYRKIHIMVKSKWYGKLTTAVFYLTVFFIFIFNKKLFENKLIGTVAVIPALTLTIFSVVMYTADTLRINAAQKKNKELM